MSEHAEQGIGQTSCSHGRSSYSIVLDDEFTVMTKSECLRDFGQLFMMALDGLRMPADVAEFFRTFRIGGVILFSDNYENPRQLRELTRDLQNQCAAPGLPLFIATDHEGGSVQRFVEGFTLIPAMARLGAGSTEETERVHRLIAAELLAAGVNFDLAPVADISGPGDP